jgi:hypothetical protein
MCSGCSGDYAGGFEFDDSEDPTADSGDGVTSASLRAARNIDASGGFELREDSAENCEILVSGTQIIEIRVIPANSPANDHSWKTHALGTHTPGKHPAGVSTKYYQTRQGSEKNRGYAAGPLRISRSVARVCKDRFNGWLEGTRRFVRRCTPQSP